jgi:hypothetical protein
VVSIGKFAKFSHIKMLNETDIYLTAFASRAIGSGRTIETQATEYHSLFGG